MFDPITGLLPVHVDLHYDGAWNDITNDVIISDAISIVRGRNDYESVAGPSTLSLTLDNSTGKYTRNPLSPLYGKIGRNTPIRARVGGVGLRLPGIEGSYASTPHTAALNTSGDLDVRLELEPHTWVPNPNRTLVVAKYSPTGNQRGWVLRILPDGRPELAWSTDGTSATRVVRPGTVAVPVGTKALRVELDVDNGVGGHTVTYYTSDTINGVWTRLGPAVAAAGTTSVFASTVELAVGAISGGGGEFAGDERFKGVIRAVEVRRNGTVVAGARFDRPGETSFTDATGLVWALRGQAFMEGNIRGTGEVSSWPPRPVTPEYVHVPIEAAGIRRRLGQGEEPLRSSMFRTASKLPNTVAYWPMEDQDDATVFASGVGGAAMMVGTVTGNTKDARFGSYTGFYGSDSVAEFHQSAASCRIPLVPSTGQLQVLGLVRAPESGIPTGSGGDGISVLARQLLTLRTTGTAPMWALMLYPGGQLDVAAWDRQSTVIKVPSAVGFNFGLNGREVLVGLRLVQNGSNIDWTILAKRQGQVSVIVQSGTVTGRTVGSAFSVTVNKVGDLGGTAIGHLDVHNGDLVANEQALGQALNARVGEAAADRMVRLAVEENVPLRVIGTPGDTEPLGPQGVSSLLELFDEAADADLGILCERRDSLSLEYRTRETLYNQAPALVLDYGRGQVYAPFEPTDDDQETRNDVTVARKGGSSSRAVLGEGPLSVQAPPDGVGRYDSSVQLSLAQDAQAIHQAGWRLHLGTVDGTRYPQIRISLNRSPELIDAVTRLNIGDRVQIVNLPVWLPPGNADLIVQGYTEELDGVVWNVTLNCTPAQPWTVGIEGDRADTDGSSVAAEFAAGVDTSMQVRTDRGPEWTTNPEEFPFDITASGAELRVTGIYDGLTDRFNRSVTGGWGSTDTGEQWEIVAGSPSSFSVNGQGLVSMAGGGTAAMTNVAASIIDVDVYMTVSIDQLAAGGWFGAWLLGRFVDGATFYTAKANFQDSKSISLVLTRGGTPITSNLTVGTYKAGEQWRLRLQVVGNQVRGKLWRADKGEPRAWMLEVTDSVISGPGRVGLYVDVPAGATNTFPVVFAVDDLQEVSSRTLHGIQTFTVEQTPVNGVEKTIRAGSDVRLTHPMIVKL